MNFHNKATIDNIEKIYGEILNIDLLSVSLVHNSYFNEVNESICKEQHLDMSIL